MNQTESSTKNQSAIVRDEHRSSWGWSLLWLTLLVVCTGSGVYAIRFLATVPPPPNCKEISPLSGDGDRLYCAQKAASTGSLDHLLAGVELVKNWSAEHPLYSEAQRLMKQWSQGVILQARQKMNSGKMEEAMGMIGKIPETSPVYSEAQNESAAWKKIWEEGAKINKLVLEAIEAQKWQKASEKLQLLSNLDDTYWRTRGFVQLRNLIASEKKARLGLAEAREQARYNTPEKLEEAIEQARKIGRESFARGEAQAEMARWSRGLLSMATEKLQASSMKEAIAIASRVPQDVALYREAQDLILLSKATIEAEKDNIGSWLQALGTASKIAADSPLYSQAQRKMYNWEQSIQDQMQIQFANAIANVGQPQTFNLATEVAQMVEKDRPRRIQAQTKIAHWRKQIQRIEDRPLIIRARQLAQTETIAALKSAITEASGVKLSSPRRLEAQTLIADWNKRIEVMEDKPVLDRARNLAKEGNLKEAIEVAQKISTDRVLYREAQETIADWDLQIKRAEDRETIDDGYWLAAQERYTAAINTASTIGWGRPLYYEAQDAIADWKAKRAAFYARRRKPQPSAPAYQPAPSYEVGQSPEAPAPSTQRTSSYRLAPAYQPAPSYRAPAPAPAPAPVYRAPAPAPAPAPDPAYNRQPAITPAITEPEVNY